MTSILGPLCALGSSVTWAIGSAGYSKLSRGHSPFAVNFMRAVVALPLFIVAAFVSAGGISGGVGAYSRLEFWHLAWFTVSMIASHGLGDVLFLWSTRELGVPGALAIASSYPLWTAAVGYYFQGQVLTGVQLVGLLATVSGVVLVILAGKSGSARKSFPVRGFTLSLVTSFFWAANSYAVAKAGRDLDPAVGNTARMVLALFLSAGMARALAPQESLRIPAPVLRRWLWLFGLEAFGGSYLFVYGLSNSSLAVGSALASLAPVISVPVSWAMGVERFSPLRTAGVSLAVLGILGLVGGF